MAIPAMQNVDMQIEIPVGAECPQEFFDEFEIKLSDRHQVFRCLIVQVRSATQIDCRLDEGFIHRHDGPAITSDPDFVSERLRETFAEHDSGILDAVVKVNLQISPDIDLEIKQAVSAEESEHVIEEGDSRLDG